LNELLQLALRHGADSAIHELAILEHHDGGDGGHTEPLRDLRIVVDVELGDDRLVLIRRCQLLDKRSDDATRSAPRRPEVDEGRLASLDHYLVEIVVADLLHSVGLCHSISYRVL